MFHQNGSMRWSGGPIDHGVPSEECFAETCDCGPAEPACINPDHDIVVAHPADNTPSCYGNENTPVDLPTPLDPQCDCTMRSDHTLTCASRKRAYVTRKMYHPDDVLVAMDKFGNVVGYLIEEVEVR